ncbi:hypothetical protein [Falsiroseomonas sp. HW251]|uniref:hypothetical protein n=1 Tax=Falsiroseomonas sp. HW251 TaxID=3390998 RepID=UPI003D314A07
MMELPAPEGEPYDFPEFPDGRQAVKAWVTATLGKGSPVKKWAKGKAPRAPDGAPWCPKASGEAVMRRYPFLREPALVSAHLALYGQPNRLLAHMPTGVEASIITAVMQALRSQGVLALPMHDGLIVPASAAYIAHNLLTEVGEQIGKVKLRLTVDQTPLAVEASA